MGTERLNLTPDAGGLNTVYTDLDAQAGDTMVWSFCSRCKGV